MKLEKGKRYECIKDVYECMIDVVTYYIKGKVYTCDNEGCLTDETGDKLHSWSERLAKNYFKPYDPQPKTGDKVIAWDEDDDDAEEFIFLTKVDGEFPYIVFQQEKHYDEFKTGYVFMCISFKNVRLLPKVETMTMAEALKFIKEIKGVEVKIEG